MPNYLVQRDPDNPLITVPIPGESKSQYVPHAVRLANGDVWCVVKGDESKSIHAYKSTDGGYHFARQGVAIAPTGGTNWDGGICIDPVMTYDAASDVIHYLWKGNPNPTAGYGGWAVGHGTAPGSNPMALTRDAANPILTPATVQTFFASSFGVTSVGDLYMADVIKDPWGLLLFWGGFRDQNGVYRIFRCRGGWSDFTPRSEGVIVPASPYTFVQAPCVYLAEPNLYVMIFTEGHDHGNRGDLHHTSATCSADGNWSWTRSTNTFLPNGPYANWDGKLAYAAHLLKGGAKYDTPLVVKGAWRLYYSGQPTSLPSKAESGAASITLQDVAVLP